MTKPTGTIRPINYPLNRSDDVESITPNIPAIDNIDLSDWATTDPDERVSVVLNLSLNEYVALATVVDVGRDIAYGDNSIYLWWIWVRSLIAMDICQEVLACIQNNESIQEAIANYSSGSNISDTTTENAVNLSSQLVDNPTGCDDDIIFGMTRQLVEFSDRLIKDLFEQVDASQLSATNVGYIIKLIPVLETLPIDELFEFTDKIVDDMETAYLSASTQLLKDEIACDLWCLAKANGCTLTLEQVRDYFEEKAGVVFTYTDVFAFIQDFITGVFVGNAVYYAMNILFFQIFAFGGKFLEYIFTDYLKTINAMYNDPDSDWSIVCPTCSYDWEYNIDFKLTDGVADGWSIANWSDGWFNGLGYRSERSTTPYNLIYLQLDFPIETTIVYVEFTYETGGQQNTDNATNQFWTLAEIHNAVFTEIYRVTAQNTPLTDTRVMYDGADIICDSIRTSNNPKVSVGGWYMTGCTVRGKGTDPYA